MGQKADIQSDIGAAFDTDLADAVFPLTYEAPDGTQTTGRGVRTRPSSDEQDGEAVKVTTAKFIILTNELDAEPEVDGLIIFRGRTYQITKADTDAEDVAYKVYGDT